MPLLENNDFGVTDVSYTLPDTASADIYNGVRIKVGFIHQAGFVTITATGADTLIGSGVSAGSTSVQIFRPGEILLFEADTGRNQWIVAGSGRTYVEF